MAKAPLTPKGPAPETTGATERTKLPVSGKPIGVSPTGMTKAQGVMAGATPERAEEGASVSSSSPASPVPAPTPPPRGFERRPAQPTMHPRRVVGGLKLQTRGIKSEAGGAIVEGESATKPAPVSPPAPSVHWSWASARWMRIAEQFAPGDQLAEGLEYARTGQTRQMEITAGMISTRVQGRMPQAYRVTLRVPTFTPEQWDSITGAMSGQAKYAASLLASELPPNIEDLFAPVGLHLFPPDLSDMSVSCDCDVFRRRLGGDGGGGVGEAAVPTVSVASIAAGAVAKGTVPVKPALSKSAAKKPESPSPRLCKHICCTMYLVAERLAQQGLLVFALRGLGESDLLERLRTQRAIAGLQRSGGAAAPVYTPHLPSVSSASAELASCVHTFWQGAGEELREIDMPIEPPAVTHPLLRRMGASPLGGAKFPLVGLLATCYDVISERVIREAEGEDVLEAGANGANSG